MMSDLDEGLIWASKNGKIELVQLLIENGIDVNAVDDNGFTALRHASMCGHLEIVRKNGLKFNYEFYGFVKIRLIYKLPAKGSSIFKNCKSFGLTPYLTNEEFQMISVEEAIDYMEDLDYEGLVKDLNSIN